MAKVFGEILRDRRLKVGLSQEELAHDAGVHPTYVSLLERGKRNPTVFVVLLLAQALGTTMTALVRDTESVLGAG